MASPSPTALVSSLTPTVPFVAPEELERWMGKPFRLRLGANESAFGPSPKALEAAAVSNPSRYGDPKAFGLRTALAARHGVAMEEILVASGIDELLGLFCRAFVAPGDGVVTTEGSYPTFEYAAAGVGARIEREPYRDFRPDLRALAGEARGKKIAYLANPDNPTGTLMSPEEVGRFRAELPEDCLLLLDEAYADFVAAESLSRLRPVDPGVVRLRTFSKAHGLAGLRVGYAIGHVDHIAALDRIRLHFGVNGPAQAAALASLADEAHLAYVIAETIAGRTRLAAMGEARGWTPRPSAANFVLFEVGGVDRAIRLVEEFARRGVFVRHSAGGGLRITVGRPSEMDELEPVFHEVASIRA